MKILSGKVRACLFAGTAAGCLIALAISLTPATSAGIPTAKKAKTQKVSLLYALNAGSGTLTPKKGKASVYKLTLRGPDRDLVWFSDRPVRRSGSFPVSGLADSWKAFGFAADPPNAALTYSEKNGRVARTAIVELSHPEFAKGKLSFAARVLDPKSVKDPNLAYHAAGADRDPRRAFSNISLFIDDGEAPVFNGCVFQPFASCSDLNLSHIKLEVEFLEGSEFSRSNFEGADFWDVELQKSRFEGTSFENAKLFSTNFSESDLSRANFKGAEFNSVTFDRVYWPNADLAGADLGSADFTEAKLEMANFGGANLSRAGLSRAELMQANFKGANLTGAEMLGTNLAFADLEGADLAGAEVRGGNAEYANVCNATLPNGRIGPCPTKPEREPPLG
jgi:uncharacterized protein YjbI with pentapeptide repeats